MQCKIVALVALLLPLAALAQDTTGQKVNHAPGKNPGGTRWPSVFCSCSCGSCRLHIADAATAVAASNLLQPGKA
jgi:hypothetical protein